MKFEVRKSIRNMAKAGVLAGSLLGLSMAGQSASAAQGQTKIDVSFPPLVILYYYDEIDLNLDADDLTTATGLGASCAASAPGVSCELNTGSPITPTLTAGSGTIGAEGAIETSVPAISTIDTTIDFTIDNAWAVRSLGTGSLNAAVTDAASGGDFSSIGTSQTSVSRKLVLDDTNRGDIQFSVDLTALSDPTAATDDVLITISTP